MLSWAVWFKFLLNKVIANTYLFILTSFSKQSASWKVLEICELCALSTDSRKTYSVIKYMYTGSSSYSFGWGGGGIIRWGGGGGGRNGKDPKTQPPIGSYLNNWTRIAFLNFSMKNARSGRKKFPRFSWKLANFSANLGFFERDFFREFCRRNANYHRAWKLWSRLWW